MRHDTWCAHVHRNTVQLGEKRGREQVGKCCQESLRGFAPFALCSCLTTFEVLLATHHLLLFLEEIGRTTPNCSSFHQWQPVPVARATGRPTRLLSGPQHSRLCYPSQLCSPSKVLTEVTPHPHAHKQHISHTAPKQLPKPKTTKH